MKPLAILVLAVAFAAPAHAGTTLRTITRTIPASGARSASIAVPVGEVELSPSDDNAIHVDLRVVCGDEDDDRCPDLAEDVSLDSRVQGDRVEVEVDMPRRHTHSLSVKARITVPRSLAVTVDMSVGTFEAQDLERDLDVRLSVGEATVVMSADAVRSVTARASVGDAHLERRGESFEGDGWLGKHLSWDEGKGRSRVQVAVNVGEASVRLR